MANNVNIGIRTKYDGKGFKKLRNDADKSSDIIKSIGAKLAAGFLTAEIGRRAEQFLTESIQLAKVQAAAEAQLATAIRSTGGAAGISAGEMKRLASELQGVTNYGDEATIKTEALLLTFTKVGNEVFPRATRAILDVSTAMGQDLQTSTIQVGKALNDPISGLTNLRRVGIQFTDAQEKQIKTLVEAGEVAEAQGVILSELERQFGGSAEAARQADQSTQALANSYGDFQEAIGRAITPTSEMNELLIAQLDGMTKVIDALVLLGGAYVVLNKTGNPIIDTLKQLDLLAKAATNPVGALAQLMGQASDDTESWVDALIEYKEQMSSLTQTTHQNTGVTEDNTDAIEKNAKAQEEAAKHLEMVAEIRRDTARELIDIDEQAQDDIAETWDDFWDNEQEEWEDHNERLRDIRKQAAAQAKRDARDLEKALARVGDDERKQIQRLKQDAKKQDDAEAKRKHIDAVGDERLFQFELRQLAAEGQANAIKAALERREIEQAIAKEKAEAEKEIEDEKLQDQIDRVRQDAQERRDQLRQDAQEESQLRDERLAEEMAAEEENYAERSIKLREWREEKLAEIEASRQESVTALGRELAEMGELSESELSEMVELAGRKGEEFGEAFADGIAKGLETNKEVNDLLGLGEGGGGTGDSTSRRMSELSGFQHGGSFMVGGSGGPDSQLVAFRASPGERVSISPPNQNGGMNINIYAQGGGEQLAAILQRKVDEGINEYHEKVLVPWSQGL